jgi:hypothetical protein
LKTPLLHRFLWNIGVFVRPPHFASFLENVLIAAIGFGGAWAVILLSLHSIIEKPVAHLILTSVKAGFMFGSVMAIYWAVICRVHKLPKWEKIECTS